jgi:L-fucose isomerase-like protein
MSYLAEGAVLDIAPQTFGGTGIFAIPHFARFYRHVLIEQGFPHHGAVAFGRVGGVLFDALKLIGVDFVGTPQPPAQPYPGENPFT